MWYSVHHGIIGKTAPCVWPLPLTSHSLFSSSSPLLPPLPPPPLRSSPHLISTPLNTVIMFKRYSVPSSQYFNCFILMTIVVSPVPSGGLLLPVPPPSLLAALSSLSEQMASPPSPDLPAPRPLRLERFTRSLVPSSTVCFFFNSPPPPY